MTDIERQNLFEREMIPHMSAVYAFALRMCRNRVDAEDLVQDTYIKAYRFLDKFEEGTNAKAWLLTILRNTFINQYRRKHRNTETVSYEEIEEFYETLRSEQVPSSNNIEAEFDRLLDDEVLSALESLPDSFRVVVILCDIEELSYEEAAAVLNCPVGTVRSRLHRGRAILAKKLLSYARQRGYDVQHASERFDIPTHQPGEQQ